jgi:hypothetical protein
LCRKKTQNDCEIEEKEDEDDSLHPKVIRKGCWNNMLRNLTRRRRYSFSEKKNEIDRGRYYPSKTFAPGLGLSNFQSKLANMKKNQKPEIVQTPEEEPPVAQKPKRKGPPIYKFN